MIATTTQLGFTCRACGKPHMRVSIDRPGILQTVLKLTCGECGAVYRPPLNYESANMELIDGRDVQQG